MAKIVVNFDTTTKDFSVTMDGKEVENVRNVGFWHDEYDDKWRLDMSQSEESKEEGMRVFVHTSANFKDMAEQFKKVYEESTKETKKTKSELIDNIAKLFGR